jgi:hypothetical protein
MFELCVDAHCPRCLTMTAGYAYVDKRGVVHHASDRLPTPGQAIRTDGAASSIRPRDSSNEGFDGLGIA